MTITVNQPEKIKAVEGQKLEFKTSAFYAPGEHNPGLRQMRTIAETVAAFMNAEGGVLVIGVADDGTVKGIGEDLDVLGFQASSVALRLPQMDDSTFKYDASHDKYQLKLRNILKAFLGPNHMKYLGKIKVGKVPVAASKALSSEVCCLVEAKKCDDDDFVYCSEKYSANSPVVGEIFLRSGNQKRKLQGAERPVLKVLEKLQEVDAAKFDELADTAPFSKFLVRVLKPRERHSDCYTAKFGVEGKVRVKKSLGNKVYLWQEDKVLRKLIAAFGVDVSKFMFVAG